MHSLNPLARAGEGAMFVSWSTGNASIKTHAGEAASLQNLAGLASTVRAARINMHTSLKRLELSRVAPVLGCLLGSLSVS